MVKIRQKNKVKGNKGKIRRGKEKGSRERASVTDKDAKLNLLLIISLILVDQFVKLLFRQGKINYSTRFLGLTLTENTGALFGVMQNSSLLIGFASLIIIGLLLYYYDEIVKLPISRRMSKAKLRMNRKLKAISLNLILAGLISNTIERFTLHYVTDFFCLSFWPCFNLADSLVVVGVILYLYSFTAIVSLLKNE